MDKFLGRHKLYKFTSHSLGNLYRLTTSKGIELVTKIPSTKKSPGLDGFAGEVFQTFKEKLVHILSQLFQKLEKERTLNTFFEANSILIPKPKTSQENHRLDSLKSVDAKIHNKMLANQIQQIIQILCIILIQNQMY